MKYFLFIMLSVFIPGLVFLNELLVSFPQLLPW